MDFHNAEELIELCNKNGKSIADIMREREITETEATSEEIETRMIHSLEIMRESVHKPLRTVKKSVGGLIGGEASKLNEHSESGKSICGNVLSKVLMYSQAVPEVNASMGVIVAAPTAGSAGVIPGVLLALADEHHIGDQRLLSGLLNASAIGYLLMRNSSVSGAEAG